MKKISRNDGTGVMVALVVIVVFFLVIPAGFSSIRTFLFGKQVEKVETIDISQEETSSDFAIEDIEIGRGDIARPGNQIVVHYVGRFTDGTVFDSSTDSGVPFTFTLGEGMVIGGWDLGVEGMRVGGKRVLVIPPELAYGREGRGPIPGDTTLIFEIELLDVLDLRE